MIAYVFTILCKTDFKVPLIHSCIGAPARCVWSSVWTMAEVDCGLQKWIMLPVHYCNATVCVDVWSSV